MNQGKDRRKRQEPRKLRLAVVRAQVKGERNELQRLKKLAASRGVEL